jgi:hypothetical protein
MNDGHAQLVYECLAEDFLDPLADSKSEHESIRLIRAELLVDRRFKNLPWARSDRQHDVVARGGHEARAEAARRDPGEIGDREAGGREHRSPGPGVVHPNLDSGLRRIGLPRRGQVVTGRYRVGFHLAVLHHRRKGLEQRTLGLLLILAPVHQRRYPGSGHQQDQRRDQDLPRIARQEPSKSGSRLRVVRGAQQAHRRCALHPR